MRYRVIMIAATMGLSGCAVAPAPQDRAVDAAAFAASQAGFRSDTLSPALQYCIRQQGGFGMNLAILTNAGFAASNSATMTKPIEGNIGNPPARGSAFVVSVNGCTIRTNGFSIGRSDLNEAIAQDMTALGFSPTPSQDNGRLGLPPAAQGFRSADRVLGVVASASAAAGVPFVTIAIAAP